MGKQLDIDSIKSNDVSGLTPSFWEVESWINGIDVCVVGSGIVGLNAAIEAKVLHPKARVVVMDRGVFPLGASTRNAGFACFGSMTELLDDLNHRSLTEVMATVKLRWEGLASLRAMLGDKALGYKHHGSYELFTESDKEVFEEVQDRLTDLNAALDEGLNEKEIFSVKNEKIAEFSLTGISHLIYNRLEGQIHTGKMMRALIEKAHSLGIEIWNGVRVKGFEETPSAVVIDTSSFQGRVGQLILATNAFTNDLFPGLDLKPSRNQVLITQPIPNLTLKGCFHYHQGYGYLRNVGNRVLIGGWRHLDLEGESTEAFGKSDLIQHELKRWLSEHILLGKKLTLRTNGVASWG